MIVPLTALKVMKKEFSEIRFSLRRAFDFTCYHIGRNHYHGHDIHSPFMYHMVTEVFIDNIDQGKFYPIEAFRHESLADNSLIRGSDPGAGPRKQDIVRSFGNFVRNAAVSPRYGRMLARLVRFVQPEMIIEWGTGTGISAMYMASAKPDIPVYTIEGNQWLAERAESAFSRYGFSNVHQVTGLFDNTFHLVLPKSPIPCLFFIDGNHTASGTKNIIRMVMNHIHPESVIVLDDIRWSEAMFKTWKEVISLPEVKVSIDLFTMGILLFRPGLWKQHYRIRF